MSLLGTGLSIVSLRRRESSMAEQWSGDADVSGIGDREGGGGRITKEVRIDRGAEVVFRPRPDSLTNPRRIFVLSDTVGTPEATTSTGDCCRRLNAPPGLSSS
jgi:hypothetical protein